MEMQFCNLFVQWLNDTTPNNSSLPLAFANTNTVSTKIYIENSKWCLTCIAHTPIQWHPIEYKDLYFFCWQKRNSLNAINGKCNPMVFSGLWLTFAKAKLYIFPVCLAVAVVVVALYSSYRREEENLVSVR